MKNLEKTLDVKFDENDLPKDNGYWFNALNSKVMHLIRRGKGSEFAYEWEEADDSFGGKWSVARYLKGLKAGCWTIYKNGVFVKSIYAPANACILDFGYGLILEWHETNDFKQYMFTKAGEYLSLDLDAGTYDIKLIGAGGKSAGASRQFSYACASGGSGSYLHGRYTLANGAKVKVIVPSANYLQTASISRTMILDADDKLIAMAQSGTAPCLCDRCVDRFEFLPGRMVPCTSNCFDSAFMPWLICNGYDGVAAGGICHMGADCRGAAAAKYEFQYGMSEDVLGSFGAGTIIKAACTNGFACITKVS